MGNVANCCYSDDRNVTEITTLPFSECSSNGEDQNLVLHKPAKAACWFHHNPKLLPANSSRLMRRASAPGDMWFEGEPVVVPHSSSLSSRSPRSSPAKRVLITSLKPWFSGQPQETQILGSDEHTAAVGNAVRRTRKPRVRRKKAPIQPKIQFTLAEEFEMLVADDQEIMHHVLRQVAMDEKFTKLVADLPAEIRHKIVRQDVSDIASKHLSDQEMDIQFIDNILSAELLPPVPKKKPGLQRKKTTSADFIADPAVLKAHKFIRKRVKQQVKQEEVKKIVEIVSEDDATAQGEDSSDSDEDSDCCDDCEVEETETRKELGIKAKKRIGQASTAPSGRVVKAQIGRARPVPATNRGHFAMIKKLQKLSGKGFGVCKAALYKHNVNVDAAAASLV